MIINGEGPSPCFNCPQRNYAAGCNIGCERRDRYLALKEQRRKKEAQQYASKEVLQAGIKRRVKSNGKPWI